MLVLFMAGDSPLREKFSLSFSYRYSEEYTTGMKRRMPGWTEYDPMYFADSASGYRLVAKKFSSPVARRIGSAVVRLGYLLLKYPIFLYNVLAFMKYFRSKHIDLFHINNGGYPGAFSCSAAAVAASLAGIPKIVYVVNNIAVPYGPPGRWLDMPIDWLVKHSVDIFITGSCYAGGKLQEVLRLPTGKLRQICNGISPRCPDEDRERAAGRLGLTEGRLVVTMVALFEERKGHRFLVEAMERLMQEGVHGLPSVVLEGTGPLLESIKTMVEEKGLGELVRFTEERNIFNLLAISDIVVLPSIKNEDFPNIVIEAMSLGKAVIASDFGGIREQVEDGESGFLVRPGDVEALAEKIRLLTEDGRLLKEIGENARRRFSENFTSEIALRRYGELYSELLETDKEE